MIQIENPKDIKVVAYVQPAWEKSVCFNTGSMVLSSWAGNTKTVWLHLDTLVIPPMGLINDHVIEGHILDAGETPLEEPGWIKAVAFVQIAPKERTNG